MCFNQKLWSRLISEVGVWSATNFGEQVSKWFCPAIRDKDGKCLNPSITVLHHVAPLLGLIEECGELSDAYAARNHDLVRDSIGDILIYLADYFYRVGIEDTWIDWSLLQRDDISTMPIMKITKDAQRIYADWRPEFLHILGKLTHINLKRHQGIRGYDGDKFFVELRQHLTDLIREIRLCYVGITNHPLTVPEATDAVMTTTMNVWGHVQQRNWKKSPGTGGS